MKKEDIRKWVNRLGIKKVRFLNYISSERMFRLGKLLLTATPIHLRDMNVNHIPNIVSKGNCEFTIFKNIGQNIGESEIKKYYKKGHEEIKQLVKAWSRFGVVLEKIKFHNWYNGSIIAYFVLKK